MRTKIFVSSIIISICYVSFCLLSYSQTISDCRFAGSCGADDSSGYCTLWMGYNDCRNNARRFSKTCYNDQVGQGKRECECNCGEDPRGGRVGEISYFDIFADRYIVETVLCGQNCPTPTPIPTPTPVNPVGYECGIYCFPTTRPSEDIRDMFEGKSDDKPKPELEQCCIHTPILIDVYGDGFTLTDAANGVMFDFNGDGVAHRISWTAGGADDAWLVLDRNNNGKIDSSLEMFGNQTDQPPYEERNGFLALAEYDKAANGGNGDGSINNEDAVFDDLRLWQDLNHDGISQSSELETLPSLNVTEIELDYNISKKTDEFGNEFRYRAKVWSAKGKDKNRLNKNKVGRWAWDVFLKLETPSN